MMPLSKKIITYAAEIINGIINFGTKTPSAQMCRGRCGMLFLEGGFGDGDVREAVALTEAAAQVLVSAVHRAGAAAAGHKIVDVSGFDLLAADIAADGIFNDLHSDAPSVCDFQRKLVSVSVFPAHFIYRLGKNGAGVFIRIIVIVFLEDVILSQFTPKVVLFQPIDPSAKFGKGFALELPRIAVLLLVEPNIPLLTIFAIMHNSKVAAVDDAGGGVVHFFDGQHAGGVFAALIPISRRYAVDRIA